MRSARRMNDVLAVDLRATGESRLDSESLMHETHQPSGNALVEPPL
jgi:hypothetical protein